jgi:hypothetical protein
VVANLLLSARVVGVAKVDYVNRAAFGVLLPEPVSHLFCHPLRFLQPSAPIADQHQAGIVLESVGGRLIAKLVTVMEEAPEQG